MTVKSFFSLLTKSFIQPGLENISTWLRGLYLFAMYIACIAFVVSTLAAHQIQQRVGSIFIDGKPVSIWAVRNLADFLEARDGKIFRARDESSQRVKLLRKHKESFKKAESIRNEAITKLRLQNDLITAKLRLDFSTEYPADGAVLATIARAREARTLLYDLENKTDEVYEFINGINSMLISWENDKEKLYRMQAEVNDLNLKIAEVENEIISLQGITYFLEKAKRIDPNIDGEEGINLHNMVGEVNSLRYLDILNIFELVTLQPEILTLMLVMVMGALGALIHVTQGYLKQETEESWAVFLFRPLLGVVSALAIYILARAGVLVVSNSGQSAGNAGLSPFFVSFLAIISGLLAESAISNIREAGKNFLKPVDTLETLRWSNGIAEEIEAQAPNKELENLVTILGLPKREVDDIVNGRIPAPEHIQTAIAAWLDKQPRQLFTDLKPS